MSTTLPEFDAIDHKMVGIALRKIAIQDASRRAIHRTHSQVLQPLSLRRMLMRWGAYVPPVFPQARWLLVQTIGQIVSRWDAAHHADPFSGILPRQA